jgi:hypothetical protein
MPSKHFELHQLLNIFPLLQLKLERRESPAPARRIKSYDIEEAKLFMH